MQINRIRANYNRPAFGKLIIAEDTQQLMDETFTKKQLKKVDEYKKELADTKQFDLEIFNYGPKLDYWILHKDNLYLHNRGQLRLVEEEAKTLYVAADAFDIYGDVKYKLNFSNKIEKKKVEKQLDKWAEDYNQDDKLNNFKTFERAVKETKMLDQHFEEDLNAIY